jgi:hypothetical protein
MAHGGLAERRMPCPALLYRVCGTGKGASKKSSADLREGRSLHQMILADGRGPGSTLVSMTFVSATSLAPRPGSQLGNRDALGPATESTTDDVPQPFAAERRRAVPSERLSDAVRISAGQGACLARGDADSSSFPRRSGPAEFCAGSCRL